ncbi:Tim44-like domain-containing protein [Afipia sp. 1NLS2]|uniref:Tim44 domain-containing protein n=1 Tax=Afipia sp. 1NLS2 TaxID=666684 RepID=UPI0001DA0D35|nr:Tim44-like domain-containing protein [Afipia sp. 1NLS2]EFI52106.1 import inner membrane translocase subunit Tim44 [Afipia sp. 1NLS2]
MIVSQRARALLKTLVVILSVAMPLTLTVTAADARVGGGFSSGSRGSRTFAPPPTTRTAPNAAQPMQRTITPNTTAPVNTANRGGFFNRGGLLGGLAAGFLGAGLFGMLFGNGLFGGLGGLSSILGLVIQLALIYFVVRLAMSWWANRNAPSYANNAPPPNPNAGQSYARTGFGFGAGSGSAPLEITPADYEVFERRLNEVQEAWSNEDMNRLHAIATPEMVSYMSQDLASNSSRGVINKVTNVKLLQGDLAEAWREGSTDYATVAMHFSLVDKTMERSSGRMIEGSDTPQEVTEIWTFVRRPGADWELSAIQQTS